MEHIWIPKSGELHCGCF